MYCHVCGIDGGTTCPRCGLSLLPRDAILTAPVTEPSICLWNPDVAALLSWLAFGLPFGALIHAANWHELKQLRRMWESIAWAALPVACYALVLAFVAMGGKPVRHTPPLFSFMVANGVFVLLWYVGSGRAQGKYIAAELKGRYSRRNWAGPVSTGVVLWILAFLVS
jgi:hypothetical protein